MWDSEISVFWKKAIPESTLNVYIYIYHILFKSCLFYHTGLYCLHLLIKLLIFLSDQSTIGGHTFWTNCYEKQTSDMLWPPQSGCRAMHTAEKGASRQSSTVRSKSAPVQAHALFSSPKFDLHTKWRCARASRKQQIQTILQYSGGLKKVQYQHLNRTIFFPYTCTDVLK